MTEPNRDAERTQVRYRLYDEEQRLNTSHATCIEFLTTVRLIRKYLKPEHTLLDIGAGTGVYSRYFADRGHAVSAVELSEENIQKFRDNLREDQHIDLRQGNAVDLSFYDDESFDIVLLFGPLYHLHDEADRAKAVSEARRVCKNDGTLFFSFINHDIVILRETWFDPAFLQGDSYDHVSFRLENDPFVFFTVDESRRLLKDNGIDILHAVAADGPSEILAEKLNAMDEDTFAQYLRWHWHVSEKPEMLGASHHLLYAGKKSWKEALFKKLDTAFEQYTRAVRKKRGIEDRKEAPTTE